MALRSSAKLPAIGGFVATIMEQVSLIPFGIFIYVCIEFQYPQLVFNHWNHNGTKFYDPLDSVSMFTSFQVSKTCLDFLELEGNRFLQDRDINVTPNLRFGRKLCD